MVHLGSALPDIAAIGRFRLATDSSNPLIRQGVRLHHATDDAFHGHHAFLGWSREINESLRAADINRGAARACGHVGAELLLDGHLMLADASLRPDAQRALALAGETDADVRAVVPEPERLEWLRHLERVATWDLPHDYHEPLAVARRLWRILSPRARLAFSEVDISTVATMLRQVQPKIVTGANELIADVAQTVEDFQD